MKYIILENTDSKILEKQVSEALSMGFKPAGGLVVRHCSKVAKIKFYQAIYS